MRGGVRRRIGLCSVTIDAASPGADNVTMLHNSLFRRELLLSMNRNPHVLRRRDVHRNVGVRPGAKAGAGQVILDGAWSIECARDLPAEKAVARDAEDFLAKL